MRPECDSALHFFDDGMAQYSISSLLGDSIDSIKKAEFRQRTDSSAAKIKEIVSEIREDVTVMEQRKSRETTPTQKLQQQLQLQPLLRIPPDVRPDPVRQREQARRNEELALRFSPALRYKEMLEREKKVPKKAIVKRKFSLIHCLPERPKRESHHFSPSSVPAQSLSRLLTSPRQMYFVPIGHNQHSPTPLPYSTVPHTPYPAVSSSLPASPTIH